MHFLTFCLTIGFLRGFATADDSLAPPSRLIRRDGGHSHPVFTHTFIMRDTLDYSHGPLLVHKPDGSGAFTFEKVFHDVRRGLSTTTITDIAHPVSPVTVLKLQSSDDKCGAKSHYIEPDVPGARHRKIKIDPRGFKSDRWEFSFVSPWGEELSYRFHRDYLGKGGKIYKYQKGTKGAWVADLTEQVRWESWLSPTSAGAPTFTLNCTADAPIVELIGLMGLVLTRTDQCGL